MPAVGLKALHDILSEGTLGVTVCISLLGQNVQRAEKRTNGDVVVVIDGDQVAELQMAGCGGSFASNALHSAAITEEHERVVVDQLEVWLVENGRSMRLRNSETNGIGETLT
jgi:hypothetical protein